MPLSDTTCTLVARHSVNISIAGKIDNIDSDDTPYTTSLLSHDTQLKEAAELLVTMHVVLQMVHTSERNLLQARITALSSLRKDAQAEYEAIPKDAGNIIQSEITMPNRVIERNAARNSLEEHLTNLSASIAALRSKSYVLERGEFNAAERWNASSEGRGATNTHMLASVGPSSTAQTVGHDKPLQA